MNNLRKLAPAIDITSAYLLRLLPGVAAAAALLTLPVASGLAQGVSPGSLVAVQQSGILLEEVIVTAARREQNLQGVPIAVSVVTGDFADNSGTFNAFRLKEVVPTLQFFSTNPRNTTINIRGLGLPYGLTNDGVDTGVGLYVDGVFYPRPATGTFDFLDLEQIEVLRGPQGTLYGKNTTAGALNITTRKPAFDPAINLELSYGNLGHIQAKGSITGPLTDNVAARLSFSGTERDGAIYNTTTETNLNNLSNLGLKGQLLFNATDNLEILLAGDFTRQRPDGYAQVVAGVAPTQRSADRQFLGILADPVFEGYQPPSLNAFDRVTDTDSVWRSYQELGGAALTLNWDVGPGTLTSISAWRFWNWNPSNDRDFIGLPITTISAAPSKQRQYTQELRYAGDLSDSLSLVVGVFGFTQRVYSDPFHVQEVGWAAARFNLDINAPANALWNTPGLVDGYGQRVTLNLDNQSAAVFGQVEWKITDKLSVLPGLRYNYDKKDAAYSGEVYGANPDPALRAVQRAIQGDPRNYTVNESDKNLSGQVSLAYGISEQVDSYATYATSFKSLAMDLSGGGPITAAPEDVQHLEAGLKTQLFEGVTANLAAFQTSINDYQLTVQDPTNLTAVRGILGSAEKVRVRGVEFDGQWQVSDRLSLRGAGAYTDGKYVTFPNAPLPVELTGLRIAAGTEVVYAGDGLYTYQTGTTTATSVNLAGAELPGLSKWSFSAGGEYAFPSNFLGRNGDFFVAVDGSYRTSFSSSATPSEYLNIPGYGLINARAGFRAANGWDIFLWSRNLADKDYYELLAPSGGSGLYVGMPGDERSYGLTLKGSF